MTWRIQHPSISIIIIVQDSNDLTLCPTLHFETLERVYPKLFSTKSSQWAKANLILAHSFASTLDSKVKRRFHRAIEVCKSFGGQSTSKNWILISQRHAELQNTVRTPVDKIDFIVILDKPILTRENRSFLGYLQDTVKRYKKKTSKLELYETDLRQNQALVDYFITRQLLIDTMREEPLLVFSRSLSQNLAFPTRHPIHKMVKCTPEDSLWHIKSTVSRVYLFLKYMAGRQVFLDRPINDYFTTPFAINYSELQICQYQFQNSSKTVSNIKTLTEIPTRLRLVATNPSIEEGATIEKNVLNEFLDHFFPGYSRKTVEPLVMKYVFCGLELGQVASILSFYSTFFNQNSRDMVVRLCPLSYWCNFFYAIRQLAIRVQENDKKNSWQSYYCLFLESLSENPEQLALQESFELPIMAAAADPAVFETPKRQPPMEKSRIITKTTEEWREREQDRKEKFKEIYKRAMEYGIYMSAHTSLVELDKEIASRIELIEDLTREFAEAKGNVSSMIERVTRARELRHDIKNYVDESDNEKEYNERTRILIAERIPVLLSSFTPLSSPAPPPLKESGAAAAPPSFLEKLQDFLKKAKEAPSNGLAFWNDKNQLLKLLEIYVFFIPCFTFQEAPWFMDRKTVAQQQRHILVGLEVDFYFNRRHDAEISRYIFLNQWPDMHDFIKFCTSRKRSISHGATCLEYILTNHLEDEKELLPSNDLIKESPAQAMENDLCSLLPHEFVTVIPKRILGETLQAIKDSRIKKDTAGLENVRREICTIHFLNTTLCGYFKGMDNLSIPFG